MRKRELLFLLLILIIAAFFRLWQLDSIPPGLYPDEAINGNEAISNPGKIFYPENNGREGLFINLLALSFSLFGISLWSLKIVPAIIGILTVWGVYLLAKELFSSTNQLVKNPDRQIIALLTTFFLATSFWHVNFSRIGFRAILLPFILVFSFYFLLKFLNQLKNSSQQNYITYSSIILAGMIFGLGFYTYTSFRMAVLILPFIFLPYWFLYKKENLQKTFLIQTSLFLIIIFLVALPIGIYFLKNPEYFISRAAPISIFAAENPIKELVKSSILHFGMFNFYGDGNWRHNFAGSPMLFWPIGILFLIGLFFSFLICIKSIIFRNKKIPEILPYWLLIWWWLIMLLPGILTFEGIPHALRIIGTIPAVYIFAGLGGWKVFQFLEKNSKNKKLLILTSILFLLMVMVVQFDKYFLKWAKKSEVKNAFSANYLKIGNYLNSLPAEIQKYAIVNMPGVPVPYPDGIPMPAQTVMFIERTKFREPRSNYLRPEEIEKIKIERETIIIPLKYEKELFKNLSKKFPQGKIEKENQIWIFKI